MIRIAVLTLVALLTACASLSPPAPAPLPTLVTLTVDVKDKLTGASLHGVAVSLHTGEIGATDETGRVQWTGLLPGERAVSVDAPNCTPTTVDATPLTADMNLSVGVNCIRAPVDVPPTPPWTGQLRKARDDLGFQDADGAWQLPLCAHYGEAFSAFVHGKTVDGVSVAVQLQRIKQAGYDCIRFWDVLGYYDQNKPGQNPWTAWAGAEVTPWTFTAFSGRTIPATPSYYERLRDFVGLLQRIGLCGFHSRGDLNAVRFGAVREHTTRVASLYQELGAWPTLCLAEGNNENFQNGAFTSVELAQIVAPFRAGGALAVHSTAERAEEPQDICDITRGPPAASMYTVHGLRTGTFSQILEHIFSLGYFDRTGWECVSRVGVQGEPAGPGMGVSVGRVENNELLGLMGALSLMSRQWWVYMSGYGVFWKGLIETQPGFYAVPRLRDALKTFAPDLMAWSLYHGGRAEAPFRSPTGYEGDRGNTDGPARIFNAVRPDRRAVVAIVEGGHGNIAVQNFLDCTVDLEVVGVNADETLSRHSFTLRPREALPVSYAFGRVLLATCQ